MRSRRYYRPSWLHTFAPLGIAVLIALLTLLFLIGVRVGQADAASVTLAWDAGAGVAPSGYIVERKVGTGAYAEVARPSLSPYVDAAVPALTTICWQVKAWNSLGTSGASNQVCLNVPTAPVNLTITTSGPSSTTPAVSVRTTVRKAK